MTKSKQRNSRGGPKTEAGKKRSAQNSLKTGVYSRELLLPQESVEDFELLYETFVRDLNPQDIVGQSLVRDLVGIAWKQMRLERIETKVLIDYQNQPLRPAEVDGAPYLSQPGVQRILDQIPLHLDLFLEGSIRDLLFANEIVGLELTPELAKNIEENHYYFHELLTHQMPESLGTPSPDMMDPKLPKVFATGRADSTHEEKLANAIVQLKSTVWISQHKDKVLREYESIQQKRLLEFMERPGGSRVHDDLRRSFAKTMSEYRKHEEWRIERSMFDMGEALID